MPDGQSNVDVLPIAEGEVVVKEVFATDAMTRLLETLRADYDLVILDCAPVLPIADARVLAVRADAVLFLARWRKTPTKVVQHALGILHDLGANVAGVALTQANLSNRSLYGYGDSGYHFSSFRSYYSG